MTKKELQECINLDNKYLNSKNTIYLKFTSDHLVKISKYMKFFRLEQYYFLKGKKFKLLEVINARRKNKLGNNLNIYIGRNSLEQGITLYHGNIVINGNARIGTGCKFHGNNCVGNKGDNDNKCPIIGNNCDIGYGAVIIGDIVIADNCKIGANSVVNKSFLIPGSIIAGAPARLIDKK